MSEQAASVAEQPDSTTNADFSAELPGEEGTATAIPEDEAEAVQEPGKPEYESAEFASLNADETAESIEPNLDVILNIPVTLSMQIGRTRMTIEELMRLNRGSVVKLDRLAGEPMDVLVNGTLIAHGEVVVVNDKFGIRLLDVISPTERVKKLR
ncbi:flagellar motor switch protein FliN [Thiolapillus sp.]